jgi:hypothetical protein
LDAWFGCSEFLVNRVFQLRSMAFNFRVGRGGELNTLFNVDRDGFSGVRLVREERVKVVSFRAEASGKYREETDNGAVPLSDGWHRGDLRLESSGASFAVDGQTLLVLNERALPLQTVGFRSGCVGDEFERAPAVQVDDVLVVDASNRTVVRDSFRNTANYVWLLAGMWLLALAVSVAACGRRLDSAPARLFGVITGQLVLAAVLACYFLFDYSYWSRQYHYQGTVPWSNAPSPRLLVSERVRNALTRLLRRVDRPPGRTESRPQPLWTFIGGDPCQSLYSVTVVGELAGRAGMVHVVPNDRASVEQLAPLLQREQARIVMLMGTSQTWGAGALRETDAIAVRLQRYLAAHDTRQRYIVVNVSVSGSVAAQLFREYCERGILLRPDVLVVVLSNNDDSDADAFHNTLTKLVQYNSGRAILTVLVTEPGLSESLAANHQDMRCIAANTGMPLLDLATHMHTLEGTGFLWWDLVHLMPYGQAAAAEFIGNGLLDARVLELLGKRSSPGFERALTAVVPDRISCQRTGS